MKASLPQCTDTSGFENQRRLGQRLPGPSHGKSTEDMAVRDEKHISSLVVGVFETGTVVFVSDIGDESVETANDVFGGSGVFFVSCAVQCAR